MADEATNTGISKSQMFGKSYNNVGDTQANLCLCTKGDVKIKMGGKYINLLKDGKINAEGSNGGFYTVDSMDGVTKDGIYLMNNTSTNEDGEETTSESIYAVIGGEQFLVTTSEGGGYVSFEAVQQLTQDQVMQALSNVGLYFQTMDDAIAAGITNGLVYIIEDNQLYRVVEGQYIAALTNITIDSSGNYTNSSTTVPEHTHNWDDFQFGTIYINGTSSGPAIIVTGSLEFTTSGSMNFISNSAVTITGETITLGTSSSTNNIKGATTFSNMTIFNGETDFNEDINLGESITCQTTNAEAGNSGFLLYQDEDTKEITLEADNLIVHNGISASADLSTVHYANIGAPVQNIISSGNITTDTINVLKFKYDNDFQEQDYVIIMIEHINESGGNETREILEPIIAQVTDIGSSSTELTPIDSSVLTGLYREDLIDAPIYLYYRSNNWSEYCYLLYQRLNSLSLNQISPPVSGYTSETPKVIIGDLSGVNIELGGYQEPQDFGLYSDYFYGGTAAYLNQSINADDYTYEIYQKRIPTVADVLAMIDQKLRD